VKYLADKLPSAVKQSVIKNMERASKSFIAGKKKESLRVPERAYNAVIDLGIDVIVHGHLHDTYQRQITSNGRVCQVFCFGWKDGKRNIIHFEG
jgi:UDP-2,3-diacylglucosamine pyrophosphatase LpxH